MKPASLATRAEMGGRRRKNKPSVDIAKPGGSNEATITILTCLVNGKHDLPKHVSTKCTQRLQGRRLTDDSANILG
jgi:hypothetical protein